MRTQTVSIVDKWRKYKRILVPLGEAVFLAVILFVSYWIRLGRVDSSYIPQIVFLAALVVPLKLLLFWLFRLYHISFRFISIYEVVKVVKASAISALLFALVIILFRDSLFLKSFPRSIIFIDFMLTFIVSSGFRLFFKFLYFPQLKTEGRTRVLVIGAGNAGAQLAREMLTSPQSRYLPVAFVDNDPGKQGSIIHGVRVMGDKRNIQEIVKDLDIEEIVISIPSASSAEMRKIMEYVRASRIKNVKILPGLFHIIEGNAKLSDIRKIAPEDLLGREPVKIDLEKIASYLTGKRILVTGAGGSIGSELCRQLASFTPSSLIMADNGETELFYIDMEIREKFEKVSVFSIISDVKDRISLKEIFSQHSPQVVFHAAAYKHVPLMETNLREAVLNNIEGTRITALLSIEHDVEKFVFISTDKAINPTSIMGVTKRVSENLLSCFNNEINPPAPPFGKEGQGGFSDKKTVFVSVRFGNVLESRGSVIPIFKEQIKKGGPITITDPEMKRYLMSITEAVELVLQAGAMGEGGEVFVLDMGEPIKIINLAHDLIHFYGLEPDKDIPIVFTGKRPGEKLFEELLTAEEGTMATKHKKIFIARSTNDLESEYSNKVERLIDIAKKNSIENERFIALLKELVPSYQPQSLQ